MNRRTYGLILQLVTLTVVACFAYFLFQTTSYNLAKAQITTGFGFLSQPSGFDIGFSFIPYDSSDTYLRVFIVGVLNTLFVSVVSIFFCTLIGFVFGVAQLSSNKLTVFMAKLYVESVRNVPLLLHIVFWYFIILHLFPSVSDSWKFLDMTYINQRGLYLPNVDFVMGGTSTLFLSLAIVCSLVWSVKKKKQYYALTGKRKSVMPLVFLLAGIAVTGLWFFNFLNIEVALPNAGKFNISGGINIVPELFALVIGLSLYHGAFFAEYVRAGLLSVDKGQTEAAYASGLTPWRTMREIIIPQAMKVIIPSYISNNLNIFKNSSLGAAIAFPELVNVFLGTSLNQTGNAVEIVLMSMLFYFSISMIISITLNIYNRRIQIIER